MVMMMSDEISYEFAKFIQPKQGRSTALELWNQFRPGEKPPWFIDTIMGYYSRKENIATILVALYALTGAQRI